MFPLIRPAIVSWGIGLTTWALLIIGTLYLGNWVLVDDYSACGPWGCGPSTGTLLSIHVAWLIAMIPPLFVVTGIRHAFVHRFSLGISLLGLGLTGMVAVGLWQWWFWLPSVGEWAADYFWIRVGYAILTFVEMPLMQCVLVGVLMAVGCWPNGRKHETRPAILPERPEKLERPEREEPN
jgi:hypothetical protein